MLTVSVNQISELSPDECSLHIIMHCKNIITRNFVLAEIHRLNHIISTFSCFFFRKKNIICHDYMKSIDPVICELFECKLVIIFLAIS